MASQKEPEPNPLSQKVLKKEIQGLDRFEAHQTLDVVDVHLPTDDLIDTWNITNDRESLRRMMVGLLHGDTQLVADHIATYLKAWKPSTFLSKVGNVVMNGVEVKRTVLRVFVNKYAAFKAVHDECFVDENDVWSDAKIQDYGKASELLHLMEMAVKVKDSEKKFGERDALLNLVQDKVDVQKVHDQAGRQK